MKSFLLIAIICFTIVGCQGDQGDQGDQGEPGTRGAEGVLGPEGPQGVAGPQGISGSTTSFNNPCADGFEFTYKIGVGNNHQIRYFCTKME